tara:strand:+ start:3491 stop:3916 length:426 start_codon:yes stop_codon:yes gene_type:complete
MIKYSLECKDCSIKFESWFSSSKDFDRLKKLKLLNCKNCQSLNIEKSLMMPNLANSKKKSKVDNPEKLKDVKKTLKNYQKFIKQNFEFVGDNFTYEARAIHYEKKKPKKGIYGNASLEDVKELKEEGIETEIIPWIEDKEN